MIVVLSYDEYEQGTDPVIDWLLYYRANFLKITMSDLYSIESACVLDINRSRLFFDRRDITDEVNVIFYRRFYQDFVFKNKIRDVFQSQLVSEVTDELHHLINYLFYIFKNRTWLPSPYIAFPNKLIIADKASKFGLCTPVSKIINNKKDLQKFSSDSKHGLITKPIFRSGYFIEGKHTYFAHVNSIKAEEIDTFTEYFFPSFFQERIEREYEIRTFYLDGTFFSNAIILSGPEKGVDIKRNFETEIAHWVNYKLPDEVEDQLHRFMVSIGLNTGSIDLIRTYDGKYYFIEVNPVGQYGAPSFLGNYKIEKHIAEWLIRKDKKT